ncbi:exodeoxyribonuclease VII small subunit [Ligilactobacillus murinus]|mgnify:FL=1|jgi:exodeoxyribonuclease VII, small subunit|uniref:Exodeoxyribonuclease 7 small subunit n=2 Tax=Ligilactobacillus murinus TaxID=1622 RepID=A0A2Z4VZ05_9LACO|nr:exodeoxyribonuclease VII small subunit [Ligilactobacillus murinus]NBH85469.1 exodeoxyribonuclease VII small subunit [Lachnospiraceae bacterium]GFI63211.1 exodeoxyribonuclease 7 small subunit [Lactobacillaceae bacterium]HAP22456.1 exodeoxyribonuclease VII small subunit [Lactobacillus sp.]AWZ38147.1 exodeoxyribonuclease VII small subunit [Ligilactobacillus murinus]AWZ40866.1 exodeoxyribonuclease VII small subunit [Ligilactobacillus murinus]
MTENNLTFEQELQMLEAIVGKLEQGDVPLEEALAQFQKGVALSKKLQETLQNAEDTLTKVINEEGQEVIFEANND